MSAVGAASIHGRRRKNSLPSANVSDRRSRSREGKPFCRQSRQRGGAGWLRSLLAWLHRDRRRQVDRHAAGHEWRTQTGAALSLAFGRTDRASSMIRMPRSTEPGKGKSSISPTGAPTRRAARNSNFFLRLVQTRLRASSQPFRNGEQRTKTSATEPLLPHLIMPAHHDVRSSDVIARRLHGNSGRRR